MAVFFSFHYDRDYWRVQQIINMGAIEGQTILNAQDWESVKGQGDQAIKNWIDQQMVHKSAVVVLVGAQTANRPWVIYEVEKAWRERRPLTGIRIHGLADSSGNTDIPGASPFALAGDGTLDYFVPLHTPTGSNSQTVFLDIKANLTTWVDSAYKRP